MGLTAARHLKSWFWTDFNPRFLDSPRKRVLAFEARSNKSGPAARRPNNSNETEMVQQ